MTSADSQTFAALERSFHEPNRLQILASLAASPQGLSFGELKQKCELTDGNLSRHLKTLEEAETIRLEKTFVNGKPRTTVSLTDKGRTSFLAYLDALEKVLRHARATAGGSVGAPESGRPERASPAAGSTGESHA